MKQNIYLIGFMGTGKTTVARALQRLSGWELVDTDQVIVERIGMTIPEFFAASGEEAFRRIETETLEKISLGDKKIISCGGGVAMREENRSIMKAHGRTVLLNASPETILRWVKRDDNRPLLRGKKNVTDIAALLEERMPAYREAADVTVAVDDKTPAAIAKEIFIDFEKAF